MENIKDQKWMKKINTFLNRYYKDNIIEIRNYYPKKKSLIIDFNILEIFDKALSEELIQKPDVIIPIFESEMNNLDLPFIENNIQINARFINYQYRIQIRNIRSENILNFISIEGIIRKSTEVRPKILVASFKCKKCNTITYVNQLGNKIEEPINGCSNETCAQKGSNSFKIMIENSIFIDSQKGQMQESPDNLDGGTNPQSIEINLYDDLAGEISPGDRIIINGILRPTQKSTKDGKSIYYDLSIDVNSIEHIDRSYTELEIKQEDIEKIKQISNDPNVYEKMIQSIAPSIFGSNTIKNVKEALMLQLFSGVSKILPDGSRVRGDIHILLVGDPGVAKSQLLRYIVKLSPRGIFTSGKGASASGLTASAVKDDLGDGRWTIEGGALVMADGGLAAVDEMDKMKSEDKSALHEAMEQQTISIAKAGILTTLKSRCSLLGAANPKYGRFNKYESISEQIEMPQALISRFDLIFILLDIPEQKQDKKIADHIIQSHYAGEILQNNNNGNQNEDKANDIISSITPPIPPSLMRKYIAYARKEISPIMSNEVMDHLVKYYLEIRKSGESQNNPVPLTARQLEALIRIAEASARVRLSKIVELEDAERTIRITSECLRDIGVDPKTGKFDIDIITTGISKSQREIISVVESILKKLSEKSMSFTIEEVYMEGHLKNISKEDIDKSISRIHKDGDIIINSNRISLVK